MASQIAHIIYCGKFFQKLDKGEIPEMVWPPEKIDHDEFILGSVFPDIRRIEKNIRRKDTHMYFPKIDLDFSGFSSFQAGWKFHLFCDMRREEILNDNDFYKLESASDYYGQPAKMLEDEVVYNSFNNWEKLTAFFNHPPFIPVLPDISEETFRLWYAIVAKYVETKPDSLAMRAFLNKQSGLAGHIQEIIDSVDKLRKNKKAVEVLFKVKNEII